jgi:hypothetical protein
LIFKLDIPLDPESMGILSFFALLTDPTMEFHMTPKRKRADSTSHKSASPSLSLQTNFPAPGLSDGDLSDVADSPRTKVAWHFQGLHLSPDVERTDPLHLAVAHPDSTMAAANEVRKRMRTFEGRTQQDDQREIPETPRAFRISIGAERRVDPTIQEKASLVTLHNEVDPRVFTAAGSLAKVSQSNFGNAYPSINRLSNSKSRGKKRAGTPPLGKERLVDAERSALTWHDYEITGCDLDDPEDDGEGINGIGFKPTPAMARARVEQRRRQMEGYRSREAREARAKRSERRSGGLNMKAASSGNGTTATQDEAETARRVRFSEGGEQPANIGIAL